jgi:AraC-like DNA-binding protein
VKKALQLGVDNYLLKPIDQWELDKTLEKLADDMRRGVPLPQRDTGGNATLFRNNLLDRWVHADIKENELYEKTRALHINLSERQYQICVMQLPYTEPEPARYTQMLARLDAFRGGLAAGFSAECFVDRHRRGVAILSGAALREAQAPLERLCRDVSAAARREGHALFISSGPVSEGIDHVAADYSDAVQYLNVRYLWPQAGCCHYPPGQGFSGQGNFDALLARMRVEITRNNSGETDALARRYLEAGAGLPMDAFLKSMVPFLVMLITCMNAPGKEEYRLPQSLEAALAQFGVRRSRAELGDWFCGVTTQIQKMVCQKRDAMHPLVRRAINVIQQDYRGDLSLGSIAGLFKVSPGYLGRLFREETRVYFNDYLMSTRLQASLILLIKTDLKVREILYEIGLSSQSYFNRAFKKVYGTSPLSYRYHNSNSRQQ